MVLVAVAFGAAQLSAAEGDKAGGRRGGRTVPFTMDQIAERLGDENKLTDEQKPKVEAVNAEFTKKMEEAKKKEGYAAAKEAADKARESGDREQMKAAYTKLQEAMGFNSYEEYKKALTAILTEAQIAKLFPARRGGGEKKADAPPKEEKK
jgi:hypothetical protein